MGQFLHAQIAVTNNPPFDNEQNIVTNVLLGDGIVASNFSSVGFANGIGYFDGIASNIGFNEGVILSTGGLEMVTNGFGVGSGVSGDPDLELALNAINLTWDVNNVTILEFDFIAESESMAFNYVFGSTEYTSYTCSNFNDIFGFFLSGPGITGPYSNNAVNLALVPDPNNPGQYTNTPVAVNTVNNGDPNEDFGNTCENIDPNWESYNIYWIDNDYNGIGWQGVNPPPAPEFTVEGITGFTTPLVAEYNDLICGETYHIKLAIADAADGALNSVVFLEANSFASPEVQISTVPNADLGLVSDIENGVLEGCGEVAIQFDRAGDLSMDLNVTLDYSGDALYGIDYGELPTQLTLPAFQEQVVIPIDVFFDNISEGQENLIITISGVPVACEDVTVQDVEIIIFDQDDLVIDMPNQINIDCNGSAVIEASISGGYAPYSYVWYDESGLVLDSGEMIDEGQLILDQLPPEATDYTLTITDACLDQNVIESTTVIVNNEVFNASLGGGCEEIEGFVYLGSLGDSGYYLSNDMATWELANIICNNLGGNLVTINSAQEQAFVFNLAMNSPNGSVSNYWIGLNDYNDEGDFTWVNGEPVTYTNWNLGEPNGGSGENAVEVFSANANFPGFWNDAPAWIERNMILEIPCDSSNEILICEDELPDLILDPEIYGGVPPYNYTWFYNGVVISSGLTDIFTNEEVLTTLPGEGLYQFIAEESCGAISGDQIEVLFIEPSPYVELISYDVINPAILPEGCFESVLKFTTPTVQDYDIILDFSITGTASSNDYIIESNSITIPAGEEAAFMSVGVVVDQLEEGVESLEFNFPFIDSCSDWPNQIVVQIYDPPSLYVELEEELVLCEDEADSGLLEGFYTGGVGFVNYGWYYNDELVGTDLDLATTNLLPGVYSFIASDQCANISSADINFDIIYFNPTVTLSSSTYDNPSEVYEGCGNSTLTFNMPYAYLQDTLFYFNINSSSNFINGIDIDFIDNYIEVPAGMTSVSVDINPLIDVYNEDVETIFFEFPFSNQCSTQEDIQVTINNYYPLEIILPSSQSLCVGETINLEAEYSGGMPPYIYNWVYLNQSEDMDIIPIDVEEGLAPAIFTVTDDCGFTESAIVDIEGLSVDMFNVVWPPSEVVACFGDNSEINLDIEGGLPPFNFEWYLDGIPTNTPSLSLPWNDDNWIAGSSQQIATMPPYTPYTYNYQAVITDSCSNELEYNIAVTVDDCLMPTSFTPNGDGNNDVFWVDFGDLVGSVSLEVFNRWGSVVYRSADYTSCANYRDDCWDGSHFQNFGEKCSEGVYYYVFTYSTPIYNTDSYDVSDFVEGVFGQPHDRSMGRQRSGSVFLFR